MKKSNSKSKKPPVKKPVAAAKAATPVVEPVKGFRTQFNRHKFPDPKTRYEKNIGKSLTRQGDSLSVETIYKRFAAGMTVTGAKEALYYGDVVMPNLRKMDFSQIQDMQNEIRERIAAHDQRVDDHRKQKALEAQELLLEEEVKKRVALQTAAAPSAAQKSEVNK